MVAFFNSLVVAACRVSGSAELFMLRSKKWNSLVLVFTIYEMEKQ